MMTEFENVNFLAEGLIGGGLRCCCWVVRIGIVVACYLDLGALATCLTE